MSIAVPFPDSLCALAARGVVRLRARRAGSVRAALIPPAARRLQEPRGDETQRQPAEGDRPRLTTSEVLDVPQKRVGVRVLQVSAESLAALRGLVGQAGRC